MTTKDLEYYVNLVDKTLSSFERTDPSFERNSVEKNSIKQHFMLQRNCSWMKKSINMTNSIVVLSWETATAAQPSANPTLISQQPPTWRATSSTSKKMIAYWRLRWWLVLFSIKVFWLSLCIVSLDIRLLLWYNGNITFVCTGKPKLRVTCFIALFTF